MKVAAYQAPLLACGSMEALGPIREQIDRCESARVELLCCPEAVLGGLADYSTRPTTIAIDVEGGQLHALTGVEPTRSSGREENHGAMVV